MDPAAHDRSERSTPTGGASREWKRIFARVWHDLKDDNVSIIAAGVTFFLLLSLFPALFAALSIYGYFSDPATLERQISTVASLLPTEARGLLRQAMSHVADVPSSTLSAGAVAGIVFALWSARRGVAALIEALNIIHEVDEGRSFVRRTLISLEFTLGGIVVLIVAVGLIAAWPAAAGMLALPGAAHAAITWLRWPFLAVVLIAGLGALYRFAPCRDRPSWQQVMVGALVATLLWVVASLALSYYVSNFGHMNRTFGAVGGIVVLMLWLDITSLVILIGAELNYAMENVRDGNGARSPQRG